MPGRDRTKGAEAMDLADLLAGTADGGFAIDGSGRIVYWNRAAESMLGYSGREVMGRRCCDVLMGDDENGNRLCCRDCHIMELSKTRAPVHSFDMRTRKKAGSIVWVNVSTLWLRSEDVGDRTVHLIRDVTAARETLGLIRERLAGRASTEPTASNGNGNVALTAREVEILRLVASGLNSKRTAERLYVSPATVRNHIQNILGKLGAHSRLEAVAQARRHRLI